MKQPPWTFLPPLRCFFSTRNAQRIEPSSSIRCQNGPLLVSNASRLQVRQPANSPSVPMCRSGRLRNADLASSFTAKDLQVRSKALKSDPQPMCKPVLRIPPCKALDSVKMGRKSPFPAPPISLKNAHADQRTQDHPRTRRQPRAQAGRVRAHPEADRARAEL